MPTGPMWSSDASAMTNKARTTRWSKGFYLRTRPADRIRAHPPNIGVKVGRIGLVPGAEIKDLAISPMPAIAAAEDIAALKPGNEDLLVW